MPYDISRLDLHVMVSRPLALDFWVGENMASLAVSNLGLGLGLGLGLRLGLGVGIYTHFHSLIY